MIHGPGCNTSSLATMEAGVRLGGLPMVPGAVLFDLDGVPHTATPDAERLRNDLVEAGGIPVEPGELRRAPLAALPSLSEQPR